jgi:hypothetical protein
VTRTVCRSCSAGCSVMSRADSYCRQDIMRMLQLVARGEKAFVDIDEGCSDVGMRIAAQAASLGSQRALYDIARSGTAKAAQAQGEDIRSWSDSERGHDLGGFRRGTGVSAAAEALPGAPGSRSTQTWPGRHQSFAPKPASGGWASKSRGAPCSTWSRHHPIRGRGPAR